MPFPMIFGIFLFLMYKCRVKPELSKWELHIHLILEIEAAEVQGMTQITRDWPMKIIIFSNFTFLTKQDTISA